MPYHVKHAERAPRAPYIPVPVPLIADVIDSPLAIGVYALIARRYAISHQAVPLSANDLQRYDPQVKHGAAGRAFERLVACGWLIETTQPGYKSTYVPTWGAVRGHPRAWQMDAARLGRPPHVHVLRIDPRLLDTFLGKIEPHPVQKAYIERYVVAPLLGLRDVGTYIIATKRPATSAALEQWHLVARFQAQPLPADADILARASQQPLFDAAESGLTEQGMRFMRTPTVTHTDATGVPLFFVPTTLIGEMIGTLPGPVIGGMIGHAERKKAPASAYERPETVLPNVPASIPCTESTESTESTTRGDGIYHKDAVFAANKPDTTAVRASPTSKTDSIQSTQPNSAGQVRSTPTVQLLQTLHVRPNQLCELADLPLAVVEDTLALARERADIRDLPGFVVQCLRDHRDHGWVPRRTSRPDTVDWGALAAQYNGLAPDADGCADPDGHAVPEHQLGVDGDPCVRDQWAMHAHAAREAAVLPSDTELAQLLCAQLRRRTARAEWACFDQLTVRRTPTVLWISCASQARTTIITLPYQQLVTTCLAELGVVVPWRFRTMSVSGSAMARVPTPVPVHDAPIERPAWIEAQQWALLPSYLQAAFAGATLQNGGVRGRTIHLDRLIQTRYASTVHQLLADHAGRWSFEAHIPAQVASARECLPHRNEGSSAATRP